MSTYPPLLFKSTASGAPVMSGSVGALTTLLDSILIVGDVFTTPDDAAFTSRSAEARLAGGVAFAMLPTPAAGDRCYIGHVAKFGRCRFTLATLGVGGTYVFEYWNGATWAALTVTDGTSGFTASGVVTWTPPAGWVVNAVNGVTMFWIRVRASATPSTNPTVDSLSITGWQQAFVGTNQVDYKQGGGNQFYVSINDNGPGAGTGKEARTRGYEAMTALGTGTGPFPTVAQLAAGIVVRKSLTLDATARAWVAIADDRTVYLFVLTTDTAGQYRSWGFGDIFSQVASDGFRTAIFGRDIENSGANGNERLAEMIGGGIATLSSGNYLARPYTGAAGAVQCGKHGDGAKSGGAAGFSGTVTYPNPADGGLYISPVWVHEAGSVIRGRLRGLWQWLHSQASAVDQDTFSGSGDLTGKTFIVLTNFVSTVSGVAVVETSDTWEVN